MWRFERDFFVHEGHDASCCAARPWFAPRGVIAGSLSLSARVYILYTFIMYYRPLCTRIRALPLWSWLRTGTVATAHESSRRPCTCGRSRCPSWLLGLYKISCFTSRLYCTIIFFANTPFIVQYIAQYYQLLHPPAKFWGIFEVFGGVFCFLGIRFLMGRGVSDSEKKIVPDTGKGALLHIIVRYPPPSPPLLPTILRNIFSPRPPLLQ